MTTTQQIEQLEQEFLAAPEGEAKDLLAARLEAEYDFHGVDDWDRVV